MPLWYTGMVGRYSAILLPVKLEALKDGKVQPYLSGSNVPTVLFFFHKKSKPSRTMLPVLEEVAESYTEMVRFAQLDIDENPQTVNQYGILTLPSYLVFKNGKLTDRFTGVRTKDKFTERIEEALQAV